MIIICPDHSIVMIKRKNEPFKGSWAFPGGFVEYGETIEEAALREVQEETGLNVKITNLVGIYSDVRMDPRFHVVTICILPNGFQMN